MTITIVCDILGEENNGTTIACMNLIRYLRAQGHTVRVVCADQDKAGNECFYVVPERNLYLLNPIVERNGVTLPRVDRSILEEAIRDCDVVHTTFVLRLSHTAVKIAKAYNKVKDNNFALNGLLGTDLHNKVAGIVTTGRIGQCMARICKGYGMTVLAWDAYPNKALEEEGLLTYVSKEELFQRSDLISVHGPLIMGEGGTYHLINDKAIAMMKDGVMLVNTARGGFIDTNALITGLRAGKFHAVALDVYEGQDEVVYTDHSDDILSNDVVARLTSFPQVVVTSHQAFFTREALQAIAADTLENARNFLQGLPYGKAEVVR